MSGLAIWLWATLLGVLWAVTIQEFISAGRRDEERRRRHERVRKTMSEMQEK
jgi:hypothetical protein